MGIGREYQVAKWHVVELQQSHNNSEFLHCFPVVQPDPTLKETWVQVTTPNGRHHHVSLGRDRDDTLFPDLMRPAPAQAAS